MTSRGCAFSRWRFLAEIRSFQQSEGLSFPGFLWGYQSYLPQPNYNALGADTHGIVKPDKVRPQDQLILEAAKSDLFDLN